MKKAILILFGATLLVGLYGCGSGEDAKLEKAAPPTSEGAQAPAGGGQPKPVGERGPEGSDGPQGPAMKPEGM